jgi:hypothetical protein
MQTRWNLSYERMNLLSYWILGVSFAIAFVTTYTWLFFAGFAALMGLNFLWSWQRTRGFRRYAERNGFAFLSDASKLPFTLQNTALAEKRGTRSNCIWGKSNEIELAIFDFSFRRGKATVYQTIIGFRKQAGQTADWTSADLIGVYHIERSRDWLMAYVPRRVVEADELEDWCESLLNLIRRTGNDSAREERATLNLHRLYTEIG